MGVFSQKLRIDFSECEIAYWYRNFKIWFYIGSVRHSLKVLFHSIQRLVSLRPDAGLVWLGRRMYPRALFTPNRSVGCAIPDNCGANQWGRTGVSGNGYAIVCHTFLVRCSFNFHPMMRTDLLVGISTFRLSFTSVSGGEAPPGCAETCLQFHVVTTLRLVVRRNGASWNYH